MQNNYKFKPGQYYVGDPGFVLYTDDLRPLFLELLNGHVTPGIRVIDLSRKMNDEGRILVEYYWLAPTPHRQGTIYDQFGNAQGHDWGVFGCVPYKWIEQKDQYQTNIVEFLEPFECKYSTKFIEIGHLRFNING